MKDLHSFDGNDQSSGRKAKQMQAKYSCCLPCKVELMKEWWKQCRQPSINFHGFERRWSTYHVEGAVKEGEKCEEQSEGCSTCIVQLAGQGHQ